jgi:hypothetical protein
MRIENALVVIPAGLADAKEFIGYAKKAAWYSRRIDRSGLGGVTVLRRRRQSSNRLAAAADRSTVRVKARNNPTQWKTDLLYSPTTIPTATNSRGVPALTFMKLLCCFMKL